MHEDKLNLAKLAETLGIGKPKLLEILTGKRKPDVPLIKALYKNLNIYPAFLLDPVSGKSDLLQRRKEVVYYPSTSKTNFWGNVEPIIFSYFLIFKKGLYERQISVVRPSKKLSSISLICK